MSKTVRQIKSSLDYASEAARKEHAESRVKYELAEAKRCFESTTASESWRLRRTMECIEDAEAWLVYLQDPSIIDNEPERNLPA